MGETDQPELWQIAEIRFQLQPTVFPRHIDLARETYTVGNHFASTLHGASSFSNPFEFIKLNFTCLDLALQKSSGKVEGRELMLQNIGDKKQEIQQSVVEVIDWSMGQERAVGRQVTVEVLKRKGDCQHSTVISDR
uniref:Uncharacterized protein n=1 Tax=Molossus molossus TaxID=27622 RepID=A0A7J8GR92_MOLMO|nr:hypothetical protein HJG59_011352 [Molossus molossus]